MSYFIGIDSSTTATKALLIDQDGRVVGAAAAEYPYETPRPLWTEQDPALWWEAAAASLRRLLAETGVDPAAVSGIGLTGQMHGLVLLDAAGRVLRPAILWNDQRTGGECDEMRALFGREKLIATTGSDALTGFTAPKILWVKHNEPDIYGRVAHILLPKDFVRYRLTGEFALDRAGGAGTQLFDVRRRTWSPALIEALGIPASWLPPTFEGPEITGLVSAAAAAETGLRAGTPVVAGGGDQAANAVGTGAVVDGVVALSLGTSGVVFASSDAPIIEPEGRLHTFCHAAPGKWCMMGVMLSAAGSLRWFRDALVPETSFDDLLAPAAGVSPGSEGLLFLPYLTGERTPHPDPLARGAFVGLTVRHGRPHLTRAVLEGVAFGLRDSFELMKGAGLPSIEQVRISGGGTRSPLWRQILADVLQAELVTVNTAEGAAYGAAVLAAVGAGPFADVESACEKLVQITGRTTPGPQSSTYEPAYTAYRELYPALSPTFHRLSAADS